MRETESGQYALHDKDIREPLFDFLEERYGKIRIIEEKQMGRSRADIVMVTENELVGIEIKSDADTYGRLKRQVRDYNQYFDRNMVVVGSTHAIHVREHVPENWGIISVEEEYGKLDFYIVRKAADNPKRKMNHKMAILWKPELTNILALNGLHRYAEKSKKFVVEKIIEEIPEEILNRQISNELFERDYTTIEKIIEEYRKEHRKEFRKKRGKGHRSGTRILRGKAAT